MLTKEIPMNSAENLFLRNRVRNQVNAARDTYSREIWLKCSHFLSGIRALETVDTAKIERCYKAALEADQREDVKMLNFWIEQLMYQMYNRNFQKKSKDSVFANLLFRYGSRNILTTPAYSTRSFFYEKRIIYTR